MPPKVDARKKKYSTSDSSSEVKPIFIIESTWSKRPYLNTLSSCYIFKIKLIVSVRHHTFSANKENKERPFKGNTRIDIMQVNNSLCMCVISAGIDRFIIK